MRKRHTVRGQGEGETQKEENGVTERNTEVWETRSGW